MQHIAIAAILLASATAVCANRYPTVDECSGDGGYRTLDHGRWVYRDCAPGTVCRTGKNGIFCDYDRSYGRGHGKHYLVRRDEPKKTAYEEPKKTAYEEPKKSDYNQKPAYEEPKKSDYKSDYQPSYDTSYGGHEDSYGQDYGQTYDQTYDNGYSHGSEYGSEQHSSYNTQGDYGYGHGGSDYGYGQGGSDYGQGGSDYGQGGSDYGHGGSDYGHGGSDYGHGGSDYGQGGSDYGHGGSNYGHGGKDGDFKCNGRHGFLKRDHGQWVPFQCPRGTVCYQTSPTVTLCNYPSHSQSAYLLKRSSEPSLADPGFTYA